MKIVVLGSGGREHALGWKLAQSVSWENVFTLPGNGGIPNSHSVDPSDFPAVEAFCLQNKIDLIIVGPEVLLDKGIVDYFRKTKVQIIGPDLKASKLESSKVFSKEFMDKYGVATAAAHKFSDIKSSQSLIEEWNGQLVLKYDGLAAGKGVYVCDNKEDCKVALQEMKAKFGEQFDYLVEERLIGDEISVIGITDGKDILLFQPAQDHKQLLAGDKGPNTGGMGAYCPVPICDEKMLKQIQKDIIEPTIRGIDEEGFDYYGFLFFGIMLTETGPKLLEYNVRFGDPEAEVMLPALKSDLSIGSFVKGR